jgi:hypothetical protein
MLMCKACIIDFITVFTYNYMEQLRFSYGRSYAALTSWRWTFMGYDLILFCALGGILWYFRKEIKFKFEGWKARRLARLSLRERLRLRTDRGIREEAAAVTSEAEAILRAAAQQGGDVAAESRPDRPDRQDHPEHRDHRDHDDGTAGAPA